MPLDTCPSPKSLVALTDLGARISRANAGLDRAQRPPQRCEVILRGARHSGPQWSVNQPDVPAVS
jgi:hypothetical protein